MKRFVFLGVFLMIPLFAYCADDTLIFDNAKFLVCSNDISEKQQGINSIKELAEKTDGSHRLMIYMSNRNFTGVYVPVYMEPCN